MPKKKYTPLTIDQAKVELDAANKERKRLRSIVAALRYEVTSGIGNASHLRDYNTFLKQEQNVLERCRYLSRYL